MASARATVLHAFMFRPWDLLCDRPVLQFYTLAAQRSSSDFFVDSDTRQRRSDLQSVCHCKRRQELVRLQTYS